MSDAVPLKRYLIRLFTKGIAPTLVYPPDLPVCPSTKAVFFMWLGNARIAGMGVDAKLTGLRYNVVCLSS